MCNQNYDITYEDLNPTFLYFCTLKRNEEETNYHCHDFIEFSIILKGEGAHVIDGEVCPVKEGDFVIYNPGTYHRSLVTSADNCALECFLSFSDVHFKNLPKGQMPLISGENIIAMDAIIKQEIFKICSAMEKEYQSWKPGRYFMLKSYLIQIILLIIREQQDSQKVPSGCIFESTSRKYVVKKIIHYFSQHYSEKISLDQIAQNMYLSTFYISRIFKSETGESPINYLINLRMEKARDLIEKEEAISVQNVAACVGYDDVYHFSKLFKKHYGVAPSKYRVGSRQE